MYEYKYVTVIGEGVTATKYQEHRKIIDENAAEGWRYVGYIPIHITNSGNPVQIDMIFEREVSPPC